MIKTRETLAGENIEFLRGGVPAEGS